MEKYIIVVSEAENRFVKNRQGGTVATTHGALRLTWREANRLKAELETTQPSLVFSITEI